MRGGEGGRRGCSNKEDDDDGYEVNGYKVNGDILQWRAATRNGVALTLAVYNLEVSRGAISRWWDGWVAELADGRCDFPLVLLSQYLREALLDFKL